MKFLIDTNIFIPLEPTSLADQTSENKDASIFCELSAQANSQLYVHPASLYDIKRDRNSERRKLREQLFRKYICLDKPPKLCHEDELLLGMPAHYTNDWVDNQLLGALHSDCVDFLISDDNRLHRKSGRLHIQQRVMTLHDAVHFLRSLVGVSPLPPPSVEHEKAYCLNASDPIFMSFKGDYPGFDKWLNACKREHRDSWIIYNDTGGYAAICIVKDESNSKKILKICSFKVNEQSAGNRFGELLLKTIFDYAWKNHYQELYITVFEKYGRLITLLEQFGFEMQNQRTKLGEIILSKKMVFCDALGHTNVDPVDFVIKYGPFNFQWNPNRLFIVPIRPEYHRKLFPEAEKQLKLLNTSEAYGNAIRKAYLSNSQTRRLANGDMLLFYRSKDIKSITALGVLEDWRISSDADEIVRFVGNRTVYSITEITGMCGSRVLALLFRHVRNLKYPIQYDALVSNGIITTAPQSITQIRKGSCEWLRDRLVI